MTASATTLRLARPADAPALSALTREHIEAGLMPRYSTQRMLRLMRDPDTITLIAEEAGTAQGFAVMSFGEEKAHLVLLCVAPGQRRIGLGRRMMDWLTESARVAGIATLHLELREDNPPAFAFYCALGFEETLRVPGYYDGQVAARRMVRRLR